MNRNERQLQQIADTYGPRVLAYIARRSMSPDDAADVFQAVLLVAWRRQRDIPTDDHALAWLLGTARRCLANHRRGHARRLRATERLSATIRIPAYTEEPPDDRVAAVNRALTNLDDADRELLTLVYWEGLTAEQAADVLSIRPATARKRLERARTRLRLHLAADRHAAPDRTGA